MTTRVGIVGVGQTVHAPVRLDVDVAEMVLEAVDEALGDAGLTLGDVDNAVTASMDFWDGRTIANMAIAEVVGSYRKSEARTCADATQALIYQWTRIASGAFHIGLVTAHCKESGGDTHDIEVAATDPFHQRRLELDGDTIAGLVANLLDQKGDYDARRAAEVVVESRRRGATNPKVEDLPPLTVDEVLDADVLASPLRRHDRALPRDGACAFVLVSEGVARGLDVEPVWLTGMATMTDRYWTDRDPTSTEHLEAARQRTGAMAGWDDDDVDLVELSAQFSYQQLQFAPVFGKDPLEATCNASGGWMAGDPFVVSGAGRVAECVHQIRGTAGARQLWGIERAYAHGTHGLAAQTHTVLALERGSA